MTKTGILLLLGALMGFALRNDIARNLMRLSSVVAVVVSKTYGVSTKSQSCGRSPIAGSPGYPEPATAVSATHSAPTPYEVGAAVWAPRRP